MRKDLTTRRGRAIVRLLFNSVAEEEDCTCEPGDRCPLCEAMLALGLGRWEGARSAQVKLATKAVELGGRIL